MEKIFKVSVLALICILSFSLYKWEKEQHTAVSQNFYMGYFSQVPPNYEELLKQDYGVSPYYVYFDDVKVSIEKTVKEKYYIVYSWVTGDQSYFAINSIIEDTNRKKVKKDDFESMYIIDDRGNTHFPLPYYSLIDFPPDDPLGWRQILYVKFYPLSNDVKSIDIHITYKGVKKVIEGVKIE